jgi:hypothetical protein
VIAMSPTPSEINYYIATLLNRCQKCYSDLHDAKTAIKDRIDHVVCEEEMTCNNCNGMVNYWAYGSWDREMDKADFEKQYPKAAQIIKMMVRIKS